MSVMLVPVRELDGAPVIVAPFGATHWHTTRRLSRCDIWTMPETFLAEMTNPLWWMPLFRRDVTLWPMDARSGAIVGGVISYFSQWTPRQKSTFNALRVAWGHPFAEELGLPRADVRLIYRRVAEQAAVAA